MSIDRRRLDRLLPGLTARERAILALRAVKAGSPGNLAWRRRVPSYQVAEFNRLALLINACNCYLPQMITLLEQFTEQLRLRCAWLILTVHLGDALTEIAALLPPSLRQEAEQVAAREPLVELPWVEDGNEHSWSAVVERNGESARREVVGLWRQIAALDFVLAEVAVEFDGEDPLRPALRDCIEETRRHLKEVHYFLAEDKTVGLPEPDDADVTAVRNHFERGVRLLAAM
jgi:hypothetical protein